MRETCMGLRQGGPGREGGEKKMRVRRKREEERRRGRREGGRGRRGKRYLLPSGADVALHAIDESVQLVQCDCGDAMLRRLLTLLELTLIDLP